MSFVIKGCVTVLFCIVKPIELLVLGLCIAGDHFFAFLQNMTKGSGPK